MNSKQIIDLQTRIGTDPDGFWGRKSDVACRAYLSKLMPKPSPWPESDQASLRAFYGNPGDEANLVAIPIPSSITVLFEDKPVKSIRCNKRLAASLTRIIQQLSLFPLGRIALSRFSGVFLDRPIRGGTRPSLHAYGAAIDLMPDTNMNFQHWPASADMPIEVMEVFTKEGWISAGAFWNRDGMHFQATQ
jgi:hypothetical protein